MRRLNDELAARKSPSSRDKRSRWPINSRKPTRLWKPARTGFAIFSTKRPSPTCTRNWTPISFAPTGGDTDSRIKPRKCRRPTGRCSPPTPLIRNAGCGGARIDRARRRYERRGAGDAAQRQRQTLLDSVVVASGPQRQVHAHHVPGHYRPRADGAGKERIEAQNSYLKRKFAASTTTWRSLGKPALLQVLRQIDRIAPTDSTVLICGETGTGKNWWPGPSMIVARAATGR